MDKLDNSLVDEHTKKKNYPDKSLDNSFLGEISPENADPYCTVPGTVYTGTQNTGIPYYTVALL